MKPDSRHWALALLIATVIHASIGIGWMLPADDDGAEVSGDTGIEVMLGDDGAANQKAPAPEAEPTPRAEPPRKVEPKPVEPKPVPTPVPPRPQPTPQPTPEPVTEPRPEAPAPTEAPSTASETATAPTTAAAATPPPQPQSSSGVAGGAATARKKSYFGELAAHLARHQRYPMEARRRKITGIVTVHFRFNTQGQVQEFAVKDSSGNRLLDNEAIAMLKRAQPLPPIPAELELDMISISLPIEFSLRRK